MITPPGHAEFAVLLVSLLVSAEPGKHTRLHGPADAFAIDISGDWTPTPIPPTEPLVVLRAIERAAADDAPRATLSVLRVPRAGDASAWELTLGRHPGSDSLARFAVESADHCHGWLWHRALNDHDELLVTFTDRHGEFALHLRAPPGVLAERTDQLAHAARSLRRYDTGDAVALAGLDLDPRRYEHLLDSLGQGSARFQMHRIGDRGVLLAQSMRMRPGVVDGLVQHIERVIATFDSEIGRDEAAATRDPALVVRLVTSASTLAAYGAPPYSSGYWSPWSGEIVTALGDGPAEDAQANLTGLLWAWLVDVRWSEPPLPPWLRFGHMSALRNLRFHTDEPPQLVADATLRNSFGALLRSGPLPPLRELLHADTRAFAKLPNAHAAAASLVMFLRAIVPTDATLAAEFGGRLESALAAALRSRDPSAWRAAFAGVDIDRLERAWQAWMSH